MPKDLSDWLKHLDTLHPKNIDLGLDRIRCIAERMQLTDFKCKVITVAGTNGKGSTIAVLEAIYSQANFKLGVYTSPHLHRFNERIRINKCEVDDENICHALEAVEAARDNISLTFFEFTTLAALHLFKQQDLDVIILEVGLGGRLDAVNCVEPDLSIVTSISIDHTEFLGETREQIALEKAGIFRENKPAICGDFDPPRALQMHKPLYTIKKDFTYQLGAGSWSWSAKRNMTHLPIPTVLLQNAASALMAIECLQSDLPVSDNSIREGLVKVNLPGRCQFIQSEFCEVFDVAHNPDSVRVLADALRSNPVSGKTMAVFSMLAHKDIAGCVAEIKEQINEWHIAPLLAPQAASLDLLQAALNGADLQHVKTYQSIPDAYARVRQAAGKQDRIVVFGSFYTLSLLYP